MVALRVPGFRQKILLLLVCSMCLAQIVTMLATLATTERTVRQSINDDLRVAERTFDQLFARRFQQLSQSVEVLVDDPGVLAAIASDDSPSIKSALENQAARGDAAIAVFVRREDSLVARAPDSENMQAQQAWKALLDDVRANDHLLATLTLQGAHYQMVAVPTMAAARIGWIMMGFRLNDSLAADFRAITGLHISFYDPNLAGSGNIVSTLDPVPERELVLWMHKWGVAAGSDRVNEVMLGEQNYLTRLHPLAASKGNVYAILQESLAVQMLPFESLERNIILLFTAVLLIAILGGLAIARNIVAPLRKLAAQAERIGSGNYAVEISVNSNDEIGQLGATLNTMQHEVSRREYRILHQTQHDDLTDLPNRYLVRDRIETAIGRAERGRSPFTVVMLDIARFKKINDTLGHPIGDILLRETANRLLRRQRKTDTVARMGGDDFLLLLENTDLATSRILVEQEVLPLLSSPLLLENIEINLKFNCGFVEYPTHGDNATSLLRRSEIALYEAKRGHRGSAVYEQGRDESHRRELAIVSDLDKAMETGQLRLFYQPQLTMATGEITHAEALVRWMHPVFGLLAPDEFISVLEQTGTINRLSQWVLNEAARQCGQWRQRGLELSIAVNLSALDLLEPALLQQISNVVHQHGISPNHLILEITESTIMQDATSAWAVLRQLQQAGYRIAIDDFGTGYSSLAQLKSLPVCELKIDKSFVQGLTATSQDSVIVKSTIELAHSMRLGVVAEGIETEEGLHLLQSYGCDTGQGYFISKPMTAVEFESWYRTNHKHFLLPTPDAA